MGKELYRFDLCSKWVAMGKEIRQRVAGSPELSVSELSLVGGIDCGDLDGRVGGEA